MSTTRTTTLLLTLLAAAITLVAVALPAAGVMRSKKVAPGVCLTTGGGRFVDIPGFPGERVDRRLLSDIRYLKRRYKIFVTDGFSDDPVHAANGEHPIGLALDIVPDFAGGGTWRDINALARLAEPSQDHPVPPFRWVGYNGDAGHGRGHHLHLSWNHSETRAGRPAASVYTLRCPGANDRRRGGKPGGGGGGRPDGGGTAAGKGGKPEAGPKPGAGGNGGSGGDGGGKRGGGSRNGGGVRPGSSGSSSSGGIGVSRIGASEPDRRAPVVETGGIGLR